MKPIYKPTGRAKEYGDYACNIYTGCPHRCYYCFAPSVLRRDREVFHCNVSPREGIVDAVKRQLEREKITDKTIHLCFTKSRRKAPRFSHGDIRRAFLVVFGQPRRTYV